jgi:hypothetical protein
MTQATTHEPTTSATTARTISGILAAMLSQHEALLEAVRRHRAALSRADRDAIAEAMRTQAACIERIRAADAERRRAFGDAAVPEIARALPEGARREVMDLGGRLRALIEQVRGEQAVVEAASRSLLGHMEGLFRQVSARLSHAGTYGRLGRVDAGQQVVSGIDLTR